MKIEQAEILRKIGRMIKARRLSLGFTVRETARKSKMTPMRIRTIEEGKRDYPLYVLIQLCETLDLDLQGLLKYADDG